MNKENIVISIITVCFNSEKTIKKTIESVLNQTYSNIEYIIVDGNSKDDTVSILKSYQNKFKEKRISYSWISEPDKGIYDAMNKGVSMASGEFIAIIGSDDWYELNAVKDVVNHYQKNNADYIHGNINVYSVNNKFIKTRVAGTKKEMKGLMSFFHPASFIHKDIYIDLKSYSLSYSICSDYDFILRLIKENYHISHINKVLTNFSYGGVSSLQAKKAFKESHLVRVNNGYNNIQSKLYYYKALCVFNLKKLLNHQ